MKFTSDVAHGIWLVLQTDKQAYLPLLFQTASNSTGDVEFRTRCRIVSVQYVLCDKVTDHSGPEISEGRLIMARETQTVSPTDRHATRLAEIER